MVLNSTTLLYMLYLEVFGIKHKSKLEETWNRIDVFDIDRELSPFEQALISERAKNIQLFRIIDIREGKSVQRILNQNFKILQFAKMISLPTCLEDILKVNFERFMDLKKLYLPKDLVERVKVDSLKLPEGCTIGATEGIECSVEENCYKLLNEKMKKYCTGANSYIDVFNKMLSEEHLLTGVAINIFAKKTTYEVMQRFFGAKSNEARDVGKYAPEEALGKIMLLMVGAADGGDLGGFISRKLGECSDYSLMVPIGMFMPNIDILVQNAPNTKRAFCDWIKTTGVEVLRDAENQWNCYKNILPSTYVKEKLKEIRSLMNDVLGVDDYPEKIIQAIIKGRERPTKTSKNSADMGISNAAEQMHVDSSSAYSYETDSLNHRLISDDHFEEMANWQNELLEMSGIKIVTKPSGRTIYEMDEPHTRRRNNRVNMHYGADERRAARNNGRNREAGQRNRIIVNRMGLEPHNNRNRLGGGTSSANGDRILNSDGASSRRSGGRRV